MPNTPVVDDNDADFQQFLNETHAATNAPPPLRHAHPNAMPLPQADDTDPDYQSFVKDANASVTPPPAADYGNMPWSEVASSGAHNLIPSAWNNLKAIPSAIYNYGDTASAIGQLGTGIYSKVAGLAENQDPVKKAQDEAVLNEMVKPFTSVSGFKEALATDPFSILTTAAIPFTGGASAGMRGAELLGEASTAGKVLKSVSKAANAASYAMDPTKAALGTAGLVGSGLGSGIKTTVSAASGTHPISLENAFAAGAAKGPGAADIKNAFNQFATGQGDAVDFSQRSARAIESIKNDQLNSWIQQKGGLTAATNQPIPLQPIVDAIDAQRNIIGPRQLASTSGQAAHDELDRLQGLIEQRNSLPDGDPQKSILGMDQLKVQLGQDARSSPAPNQTWAVYHAIKDGINSVDPQYQNLMDTYRADMDNVTNLTKGLKAGPNVAANNELAAYLKNQKTPNGQSLISQVAQKDPLIPYMVAGADLHGIGAHGVANIVEKGSAPFHIVNIGRSLLSGDPLSIMGSVGAAVAQPIIQSPRVMGKIAYGLGALSTSPVGKATGAVGTYLPPTAGPLMNLQRAQDEEGNAAGGRVGRKSGGRTGIDAKTIGMQLIDMADRIKKEQGKGTKPLLNVDDTTIAKALAIANRGI